MADRYILDGNGEPVPEYDLLTWADWFEHSATQRRVALDEIEGCTISTVFLGLDHGMPDSEEPILWETIVLPSGGDMQVHRCGGGRKQAQEMHASMVEEVKNKA